MYQDIEYGGIKGSSLKIFARERPSIPAARKRREEQKIAGRDGAVYRSDGSYEPMPIEIQFNYIGKETDWGKIWRQAQDWLSSENEKLRFSDDDGYFFWVSYVDLAECERLSRRVGNFTATFMTRDGLQYLNAGLREHMPEEIQWNPYETAHPIYKITGEGMCTIEVNGKTVTANVGQNMIIDTERMVAYREDGTLQNTKMTGDYEDLYFRNGEIEVTVSAGFDLRIIPNWRRK